MQKLALCFGITLMMSVMYQTFFYVDYEKQLIVGGFEQRLMLKLLAILTLIVCMKDSLAFTMTKKSLCLLFPIIYILGNIFILIPWLNDEDLQSVNFLLFSFIIFLRPSLKLSCLLSRIFKIIGWVTLIQLSIAIIFYNELPHYWHNSAIIGGMGNPNVFGLFLIISALYFYIIQKKLLIPIILMGTCIGTGSLITAMIGFSGLIYFIIKSRNYLTSLLIVSLSLYFIFTYNFAPASHIFGKLNSTITFLNTGETNGSLSVSVRNNYYLDGINLLYESPLSILLGHPNGILLYSGDGLYIYYLVSFGLVVFTYFMATNLILFKRFIVADNDLDKFMASIIGVYLVYFMTNRILDYWPAAFPYLLSLVYLSKTSRSNRNYG